MKATSKPDAAGAEISHRVAIGLIPETPAEEDLDVTNAEGTPQLPGSYTEPSIQPQESVVESAVEPQKLGDVSVSSSATDVATVKSPLQHYAGKICSGGRCRYTARKHAGQDRAHAASDKPLPEVHPRPLRASICAG